jgi:hypothetical protein
MPGRLTSLEVARKIELGKYPDGEGLYLIVAGPKSRNWSYRYWIQGKERWHGLGSLVDVSLKESRIKRDAARHQVRAGIDIVQVKRSAREEARWRHVSLNFPHSKNVPRSTSRRIGGDGARSIPSSVIPASSRARPDCDRRRKLAESSAAYTDVVAVLNDHWRVVASGNGIQWVLQYRNRAETVAGDVWRGRSYCRTREALTRCCDEYVERMDPSARVLLATLPERLQSSPSTSDNQRSGPEIA